MSASIIPPATGHRFRCRCHATVLLALLTGAACSAGPIDLVDNTLLRGLIAHWSFDEQQGTVALDSSGHGYDGMISGGTWIPGHFNGALHFEPGVEVAVPSFPPATPTWSVGLWVRPPAEDLGPDFVTLISTELVFSGGWEMNARLSLTDSIYQFGYYLGPGDSDYFTHNCPCVVRQQWTHILATVDSRISKLTFYRDGLPQTPDATPPPGAIPGVFKPGSTTLYMGRWYMDARLFRGDLDDVVIYDRVLTAAEVAALARNPAPARF